MQVNKKHRVKNRKNHQKFVNNDCVIMHQIRALFSIEITYVSLNENQQKHVSASSQYIQKRRYHNKCLEPTGIENNFHLITNRSNFNSDS